MEQNNIVDWFFDFKKSREALIRLGFTPEEANNQTSDLLEIITLSVVKRISQEAAEHERLSFTEILTIMKTKAQDPVIAKIINEESARILENYFRAVIKNDNS